MKPHFLQYGTFSIRSRWWFSSAHQCISNLEKSLLTPTLLFLHFLFTSTLHRSWSAPHWTGKRRGLDQMSSHERLHVVTALVILKKKKKKQPLIWFDIFLYSALNPCVVCHSRKESSDSKPPSLKKTSDHVKKDRSGIWELFCFSFVLEKNALLLSLEDQWPQTLISVFCLFYTKYWHSILSVHDSNVVFRAVM